MARYTGRTCAVSRKYGKELDFKTRSWESKCNKNTRPGQHGAANKKRTGYGEQLAEKQALRYKYLRLEKQFKNLYAKAVRAKGPTGTVLLQLLECGLDNVVFRMGFAATRREARQLVTHKAILINEQCVNIPSYLVKPGDKVSIRPRSREQLRIIEALRHEEEKGWADWLSVDAKGMSGEFKRIPERDELASDINEQLIVELYSK